MKNVLVVVGSNDHAHKLNLVQMEDAEYEELKFAHNCDFELGYVPDHKSECYNQVNATAKLMIAMTTDSPTWREEIAEIYGISKDWCGKFKGRISELTEQKLPADCHIIFYENNV